jgi:hypothetical protein
VAGGKIYVADSATSTLTVLGGGTPIAYTSSDFSAGAATLTILRHRHAR